MILPLLRALGAGDLQHLGEEALKAEAQRLLQGKRRGIVTKALRRLEKDGAVNALGDPDNYIFRAAGLPGELADIGRDRHWSAWGRAEADTLLAGVTDERKAVGRVFDRLVEAVL